MSEPFERHTGVRREICELWDRWPKASKSPDARDMLSFYFDLAVNKCELLSQLPGDNRDESWDVVKDWLQRHERGKSY